MGCEGKVCPAVALRCVALRSVRALLVAPLFELHTRVDVLLMVARDNDSDNGKTTDT